MPAFPRKVFVTATLTVLLLAHLTQATVVPRLDLPELAHSAEIIVNGRILRHWSGWDHAHQLIWTHYVLEITDVLKGRPSSTVTISEPGGEAEGLIMKIAGVTEYSDQEEVVVFLRATPLGYWRPCGWGQGKYTVAMSAGGLKRIRTNLAGLALMERPPAGKPRLTATSPLRRLEGVELHEFKRLVRFELNGRR